MLSGSRDSGVRVCDLYMGAALAQTRTCICTSPVCMTARGLFSRLPWWGRERGGEEGGTSWGGCREEGGEHVCW